MVAEAEVAEAEVEEAEAEVLPNLHPTTVAEQKDHRRATNLVPEVSRKRHRAMQGLGDSAIPIAIAHCFKEYDFIGACNC